MDSGSMKPLINGACRGLVDWSGAGDAGQGEVIIIDDELGMLLSHRLIRRELDGRVLQIADAIDLDIPYSGYYVKPSRVLGRVVCIERKGRLYRLDSWLARTSGQIVAKRSEAVWTAVSKGRPDWIVMLLLYVQRAVRWSSLMAIQLHGNVWRGQQPNAL